MTFLKVGSSEVILVTNYFSDGRCESPTNFSTDSHTTYCTRTVVEGLQLANFGLGLSNGSVNILITAYGCTVSNHRVEFHRSKQHQLYLPFIRNNLSVRLNAIPKVHAH